MVDDGFWDEVMEIPAAHADFPDQGAADVGVLFVGEEEYCVDIPELAVCVGHPVFVF